MLKVKRRRTADCAQVGPRVTDLVEHSWADGLNLAVSPVGRLPGAVSRWKPGRPLSWVPLRPRLVAEVVYGHLEGDPRSCTYRQFAKP